MKPIYKYLSTKIKKSKIKATDETIYQIVKDELDRLGHDADLNHINVSKVTNMRCLFSCTDEDLGSQYKDLNPDISEWDVSHVEKMNYMFWKCENFNQDISQWNVSKVKNMNCMFYGCENFNQDISIWDVSKVENMASMFYSCGNFNKDLSGWDVRKVKEYEHIFNNCPIKEEYKPHFVK